MLVSTVVASAAAGRACTRPGPTSTPAVSALSLLCILPPVTCMRFAAGWLRVCLKVPEAALSDAIILLPPAVLAGLIECDMRRRAPAATAAVAAAGPAAAPGAAPADDDLQPEPRPHGRRGDRRGAVHRRHLQRRDFLLGGIFPRTPSLSQAPCAGMRQSLNIQMRSRMSNTRSSITKQCWVLNPLLSV